MKGDYTTREVAWTFVSGFCFGAATMATAVFVGYNLGVFP